MDSSSWNIATRAAAQLPRTKRSCATELPRCRYIQLRGENPTQLSQQVSACLPLASSKVSRSEPEKDSANSYHSHLDRSRPTLHNSPWDNTVQVGRFRQSSPAHSACQSLLLHSELRKALKCWQGLCATGSLELFLVVSGLSQEVAGPALMSSFLPCLQYTLH